MQTLIFDFDGVIVDSFNACLDAMRLYDPTLTSEKYRKMFEGNIFESLEEEYPEDISVETQNENINNDQSDFFEEYYKRIENIQPKKEMVELIKSLQDKNLYIVSSTSEEKIDLYLEKYNLRQYFKRIMGPETSKSKIQKLKMILEIEQISPFGTIFITDTLGDLKESEKAQIPAVGVTWGFHSKEVLSRGKSIQIIDDPVQLKEILLLHA